MPTVKQKLSQIKRQLKTFCKTKQSHVRKDYEYGFCLYQSDGTYYSEYSVSLWVNEDIMTNKFTVYVTMDSNMFTNTFIIELLNYKSKKFDTLSEAIDELNRFIKEDLSIALDTHDKYVEKILNIQKEAKKNFTKINNQLKKGN
jgi:hypothetical protein